jgi:hypothetical protein
MRRDARAALGLALALAVPAAASDTPNLEYDVKAAFLLNFTRFVEWPASARGEPLRVCVFRADPFGGALRQTLEGEHAHGRPLTSALIGSPADLTACDVVFVPESESGQAPDVLRALRGHAVLTIGESPEFLQHGGIFNFVVERDRVRFDINAAAADRSGLRISSKLLRLARQVVPTERRRS